MSIDTPEFVAPAPKAKVAARTAAIKPKAQAAAQTADKKPATAKKAAAPTTKPAAKPQAKPEPKKNATKAEKSVTKAVTKTVTKAKLVRDSFTMPSADFAFIDTLKKRALAFQRPAKKSELLRAGLRALSALSDVQFKAALEALTPLKPGRPKKGDGNA